MPSNSEFTLSLVVPLGLSTGIFPWGTHCVQAYASAYKPTVITSITDLRSGTFLSDLIKRFGPQLIPIFRALEKEQPIIIGPTPEVAVAVFAALGPDLFSIANREGLFALGVAAQSVRHRYSPVISALKAEVDGYFSNVVQSLLLQNKNRKILWGLSVYDSSLPSVLQFARAIRAHDTTSPIILGGGYFNTTFARALVGSVDPRIVSGVVVGRGEEITWRLVCALRDGEPISQLQIPGFFTPQNFKDRPWAEASDMAEFHPTPKCKVELRTPPNALIQGSDIHILTQRGCSWGKCTFCDQIDRRQPSFEILRDDFALKLKQAFITASQNHSKSSNIPNGVQIFLDNDDACATTVATLFKELVALNKTGERLPVRGWLQVKSFSDELARVLYFSRQKLNVRMICNTESFNFDALKAMKKGHTPLQAVFQIKAVIDTGHFAQTNVFIHFPLETLRGIKEELQLVTNIQHLLLSRAAHVDVRWYCANEIDEVFHHQERFQFSVRRRAGDVWLKGAFNVDLPLNHWSARGRENRPRSFTNILASLYARAIESVRLVLQRLFLFHNLSSKQSAISFRELFLILDASFRIALLFLVSRVYGQSFWRRLYFWLRLKRRAENQNKNKYFMFFISGTTLVKNFPGRFYRESWQRDLSLDESCLLRYLYKVRKRDQIFRRFGDSWAHKKIETLLKKHLQLGSVVASRGSFLSIANDPDYWKYPTSKWD